jgi:hypothetical protein
MTRLRRIHRSTNDTRAAIGGWLRSKQQAKRYGGAVTLGSVYQWHPAVRQFQGDQA